jgi:hypothetical protein
MHQYQSIVGLLRQDTSADSTLYYKVCKS